MIPPAHSTPDADLAEAAGREWPVVVVGAGIAGATLAFALASQGMQVLLLDRATFPRAKTCGGCLNPRAVASLERLGLGDVLASTGPARIDGVEWRTQRGRRAFLAFPRHARDRACAVSRTALDAALIEGARAKGVCFLSGVRVLGSTLEGDVRAVRVRVMGEHILRARLVVACDGLGSTLAKDAGLARPIPASRTRGRIGTSIILSSDALLGAPANRILMCCAREGYVGVVGVEDHQWDVAAAIRLDAIGDGTAPFDVAARILSRSGVTIDQRQLSRELWTVTPPHLTRRVIRPWAKRLLLVGDASGYVEPITGEGMAWALAAVEAAAPIVANPWRVETGARWESAWRACVGKRTRLVRIAAGIAASPMATEAMVAALGAMPMLGRALSAPLFRAPAPAGAAR